MIIKNLIRIFKSYKFTIIKIIIFEIIYILRGFKGNTISNASNVEMADNIPCPYFFLYKIKKVMKNLKFDNFIDLGCGSGRVIDYFNKSFPKKSYTGIEFGTKEYSSVKNIFRYNKNITILKKDFTKINYKQQKTNCFFLNNPFVNEEKFIKFFTLLTFKKNITKNTIFIFVNFKKKTINKLKKIKLINNYQVTKIKGFSIAILIK